MKQNFAKLLLFAGLIFLVSSCKKGDAGPAGATGPAGPVGPQGIAGNANVIAYTYGSQTFTGALNLLLTNISQARIDSSLVLCYYNPSTEAASAWYPCPGFGSSGAYQTRLFWYQTNTAPSTYTVSIRILTPAGASYSSALTFTKIRVIIASSSAILTGGRTRQLNTADYQSVKEYFNLPD
jgi:hypothetical protein